LYAKQEAYAPNSIALHNNDLGRLSAPPQLPPPHVIALNAGETTPRFAAIGAVPAIQYLSRCS